MIEQIYNFLVTLPEPAIIIGIIAFALIVLSFDDIAKLLKPLFGDLFSGLSLPHADKIEFGLNGLPRAPKLELHPDDRKQPKNENRSLTEVLLDVGKIFTKVVWKVVLFGAAILGFSGGILQFCVYFGLLPTTWH